MLDPLIIALIAVALVVLGLSLISLIYFIVSSRRRLALYKKVDYLLEDLTYKAEVLNPAVETITKMANYIDAFEVVARKNIKAGVRLASRNRDDIYRILNRFKKLLLGESAKKPVPKSKKGGK